MIEIIQRLEAGLREQIWQAEVDLQRAEMDRRRAFHDKQRAQALLNVSKALRAAMGIPDDDTEDTPVPLADSKLGSTAVDAQAYEPGTIIMELLGPDFWRRRPDIDEETGDPIYDPRVVSGKTTSRERALAAARVYGYRLKEMSLAQAIFHTGETNASSPQSIRGSLGGLVKHGSDWKRERGWLVYCGDELVPDRETLERFARDTTSLREQSRQEEATDQIED